MRATVPILFLALSLLSMPAAAQQNLWSTAGTLECMLGPDIRLPPNSRDGLHCLFRSAGTDAVENYTGRTERAGLDMVLTQGKLVWVVLSRVERLPPKSLTGRFIGSREDLMVGEGGEGAAALCRGTQRAVCLQPLAGADHEDGENLAFGISVLRLE